MVCDTQFYIELSELCFIFCDSLSTEPTSNAHRPFMSSENRQRQRERERERMICIDGWMNKQIIVKQPKLMEKEIRQMT